MITHRNFLKVWIVVFMFCGSMQANDEEKTPDSSFQWSNWLDWKRWVSTDRTIPFIVGTPDGKGNEYRLWVPGLAFAVIFGSTVLDLTKPLIREQLLPVLIDYLPNAWPLEGYKESYKAERERAAEDKMLADYKHKKRMAEFKKDTGLTNEQITESMKKSLKN